MNNQHPMQLTKKVLQKFAVWRNLACLLLLGTLLYRLASAQDISPVSPPNAGFSNRIPLKKYTKILDKPDLKNFDALEIRFPADSFSFVNDIYALDNEGCIYPPVIGVLCIPGRSLEQIARQLESAYSDYIRYPFVMVTPLMRVALLGGFANPGLYYVPSETPLWDVIKLGGGPTRRDGFKKMKWRRNNKIVEKNLTSLIVSGKTLQDLNFESGDVIALVSRPKLGLWGTFSQEFLPVLMTFASIITSYAIVDNTLINPPP